jgi:hypothetical protein
MGKTPRGRRTARKRRLGGTRIRSRGGVRKGRCRGNPPAWWNAVLARETTLDPGAKRPISTSPYGEPKDPSSTNTAMVELQLAHEPFGEEPQSPSLMGALGRDQMVTDIPDAFRALGERRDQTAAGNLPLCQ